MTRVRTPSKAWERWRHSLALKLYVPVFLALVVLTGLQTRFMVQTSRRLFLQATEQDMLQSSEIFSRRLVELLLFGDHDQRRIPSLFEEVRHLQGVPSIGHVSRLLNLNGRPLVGDRSQGPLRLEELRAHEARGETSVLLEDLRRPGVLTAVPNLEACQRCHSDDRAQLAWVWMEAPIEGFAGSENQVKAIGLLSALTLSVLFGLTVWFLLFLHVRRPLRQLESAMIRVSEGDLEARSRLRLYDEIGHVAHHFDEMVERLQQADEEVRRAHVQQMMRTERMVNVGEMASRMAHEIRNPLAGIEGVLSIFHEDTPEDDPERAILAEALSQVQRMKNALSDMLSFARPRPPQRVATDVVELLEGLVKFCQQDRANARHSIQLLRDSDIPSLPLDPDQIGQAFLNVILNALQVMEDPGTVTIRVFVDDAVVPPEVRVDITDSGPGIPPDVRPHIFNAFYTTKTKGTGLGLAICHAAVRQHGGDLVLLRTDASGSTFRFCFPVGESIDGGGIGHSE